MKRTLLILLAVVLLGGCTSQRIIEEIEIPEEQSCDSRINFNEIPDSVVIDNILEKGLFENNSICKEKDVYSWEHDQYTYTYFISSVGAGQGNNMGTIFKLNIEPITTEGLNTDDYPFLDCEVFSARKYNSWFISVNKDSDILRIIVDNVKPPVQTKNLDKEQLDTLASNFTICDKDYSY